jgi:hypothetical protein
MEESRARGGVSTAGDVLSGRFNLHVGRKAPPIPEELARSPVPFGAGSQSRRVTETSAMGTGWARTAPMTRLLAGSSLGFGSRVEFHGSMSLRPSLVAVELQG